MHDDDGTKRTMVLVFDRSTKHKHRYMRPEDVEAPAHEQFGILYVPKGWFGQPDKLEVTIKPLAEEGTVQ